MRLTNTAQGTRRTTMLTTFAGGRRRGRVARMFPAEAERLITPAELKRLNA